MIPENLQNDAQKIIDLINKSQNVILTAHLRPDGDAIGSVSGLMKSLEKMGKRVDVDLLDGVPSRFPFVWPESHELLKKPEIESDHDLIIVLDCGDAERHGITFKYDKSKTTLINIDHHASNTMFGDVNYVDTGAQATCEIVTALIDKAGFPLDIDIAESLMLGLMTDSRTFSNENIRYTTHEAAAALLRTGLSISRILNTLNCGRKEVDLRLQGFGLSNFKLECDEHLATLVITQKDLAKFNANVGNIFASGIFNIPLTIESVTASVVIFEREDGFSACEFRSRGGINVKEVAVALGGGGHLPASGCSQQIPIEEMAEKAIELMKKQVNDFYNK
ncbi:MAG: bifunctional oligoribonuclease/PAP phosphatase NrnA [Candidatus Riflebacteria bacterium]|nr:bifunctional oligoribonuclease/PAP phosphatase NrnA [Candidatus Riflebacteria bacterium]